MLWHLLLVLLSPLASLVSGLLRDDRDRQVLALRQQLLILQRQLGKPPRLSRTEKLALLLTCIRMKPTQLLGCLMIIKPATLIGWHRQIVRRHWTFPPKRRPGRPRTSPQAEQLVLRLARENGDWGCGKIAGEMRKLGFARFGRSTAQRAIVLNENHLRWMLKEYIRYYNSRRLRRSLGLAVPEGPAEYPREGEVCRHQILGWAVNDYYRKAA